MYARVLAIGLALIVAGGGRAEEPAAEAPAESGAPASAAVRTAIERALPLIERSSAEYLAQRVCFSCHHQALSVLTLTEARRRGFAINEANLQAQVRRAAEHLERGKENYREGKGQGGAADTAGYALWTLQAGGWPADETTAAVVEYLLQRDAERPHWRSNARRPPTEASHFTTTAVALFGLQAFGDAERQERIAERYAAALEWLSSAEPVDTEDHVFRLFALGYLGADEPVRRAAADGLLSLRRDDGGWGQLPELASDAYATATALVALQQAGELSTCDPVYQRGVAWLLAAQRDDGSWQVATRSRPIQTYFESGFPHGKDQFISMAASCWATQALLLASPPRPADDQ